MKEEQIILLLAQQLNSWENPNWIDLEQWEKELYKCRAKEIFEICQEAIKKELE